MLIAGIGGGDQVEDVWIEDPPTGELGFVEHPVHACRDLARHEWARRRHHDIIARPAGQQLGLQYFVPVIDVIGDPDPGLRPEFRDRVRRDVIRPIIDVEPRFFAGSR